MRINNGIAICCLIVLLTNCSCNSGRVRINPDDFKDGIYTVIDRKNNEVEYRHYKNNLRHGMTTVYKDSLLSEYLYHAHDSLYIHCSYTDEEIEVLEGSPYINFIQGKDTLRLFDTLWYNLYYISIPRTNVLVQKENVDGEIDKAVVIESENYPYVSYEIIDSIGTFKKYWYVSVVDTLDVNSSYFDYKFQINYTVIK